MFLLPRFFYDDGSGNTGAGGSGTDVLPNDKPTSPANTTTSSIITEEEMKALGFDSPETLKEFLKKKNEPVVTDEEKRKLEDREKANLIKYATENDLAKPDDFNQFESIKTKADRDLVFEQFSASFKEDNPEITAEDLDAETKKAFDAEYKLTSENAKVKARGEARLKKEADELRSPVTTKISKAQERYNDEKAMREKMPAYNKFIDELINEAVPEKMVVFKGKEGEEDITVDIALSADEKKEIAKIFRNEKTFFGFHNSKDLAALKTKIKTKIDGYLKANKFDAAVAEVYTKGKGIGTKLGSNAGADNPFALNQSGGVPAGGGKSVDELNAEKAANARKNLR